MSLSLSGLGTAIPPGRIDQDEALQCARILGQVTLRDAAWLAPVYGHSGVKSRYQVVGRPLVDDLLNGTRVSGSPFLPRDESDETGPTTAQRMEQYAAEAPTLAVEAARQALQRSSERPDQITHLVTVSCTGFMAPGIDFALIRGLGLPNTVERTHVGFMGCHGALNGLRVANALASADPQATVMLCAVELCSLHYYYGPAPDKVIANAIFADGAAAIVGRANGTGWRVAATGSVLLLGTERAMGWLVRDHGFEMILSKKIPELIATHLRSWMMDWLEKQGLTIDTVGSWAVHPGGPKILAAVEEGLGLSREAMAASWGVYEQYGNMSSPTVLFIVERLMRENAPRPCVALGFGPGLVAEAVLFR